MNKKELKQIINESFDDSFNKIVDSDNLLSEMQKFSNENNQLDDAGQLAFTLVTSQNIAKKAVYDILIKILNITE